MCLLPTHKIRGRVRQLPEIEEDEAVDLAVSLRLLRCLPRLPRRRDYSDGARGNPPRAAALVPRK